MRLRKGGYTKPRRPATVDLTHPGDLIEEVKVRPALSNPDAVLTPPLSPGRFRGSDRDEVAFNVAVNVAINAASRGKLEGPAQEPAP